jgi:hypothetical protein
MAPASVTKRPSTIETGSNRTTAMGGEDFSRREITGEGLRPNEQFDAFTTWIKLFDMAIPSSASAGWR